MPQELERVNNPKIISVRPENHKQEVLQKKFKFKPGDSGWLALPEPLGRYARGCSPGSLPVANYTVGLKTAAKMGRSGAGRDGVGG